MSLAPSLPDPVGGVDPKVHGARVALLGNPNTGKSTLFNRLTGASAHTGNYGGITVERHTARLRLGDATATAIDLPGTFSLAAHAPDERVAIDTLLGVDGAAPDLVVAVVDAPRLARGLYLVLQILELGIPLVVALNMMDEARALGVAPDTRAMADALGVPVIGVVARTGEGVEELRDALARALRSPADCTPGSPFTWPPDILEALERVPLARFEVPVPEGRRRALALWTVLSEGRPREAGVEGRDLPAEIVARRYLWIDAHLPGWLAAGAASSAETRSDRVDRLLLHPLVGAPVFVGIMAVVFMALFAWSDPLITLIEGGQGGLAAMVVDAAGDLDPLGFPAVARDFVVDGLIGGVGAVVVFVPQIALLTLFIALLEDSGYLARAAYLVDRILRAAGLPGQAFVPLLSGYACAVPAIMGTRTLPRFRDRLLTMLVIPLTSCSARLPVYALMIAALFPATIAAAPWLPVRPVAMLTMYALSTGATLIAAFVLGRTLLHEQAAPMLLELPPYRFPDPWVVLRKTWNGTRMFLEEAGRVILVATVLLWALLYFPRTTMPEDRRAELASRGEDVALVAQADHLEQSWAGRAGRVLEPLIRPLGYDWRIGVGLVGSFAAREVFVSTMGLVLGVGDEVDEESASLRDRLHEVRRPDGTRVFTPLVGASLMVFFAFAMQCLSTLAALRKETGGWRWPAFLFGAMTALAWTSALVVYQGGRLLGFG